VFVPVPAQVSGNGRCEPPSSNRRATASRLGGGPPQHRVNRLVPFVHFDDVDRSIAFYHHLGFIVASIYQYRGRPVRAALQSEAAEPMVTRDGDAVDPAGQGVLFYLYSPDLAALRAQLLANGVDTEETGDRTPIPRQQMRVTDPDGYVLMVAQIEPEEPEDRRRASNFLHADRPRGVRSPPTRPRPVPFPWWNCGGFDPLTPSMRTLGTEVARGRWGRSLVGGSRLEAFPVARVAVLVCCTAFGLVAARHCPKPRIRSLPKPRSSRFTRDRCGQRILGPSGCGPARSAD
jgi:hypothetical protein